MGEQCGKMLGGLSAHSRFEKINSISLMGGTMEVEGQTRPGPGRGLSSPDYHSKESVLILKFPRSHHRDFYYGILIREHTQIYAAGSF